MEFNFRAIDGNPSTYIPRTSTSRTSYLPEQALRVGYSSLNFGNTVEYFRNPNPMDEVLQRELEKKRIREEIIAAEITRRRALEEEVRREMMVERQMALRRGGDVFSIFPGFDARLPILHQSEGMSLEERVVLALEEKLSNGGRGGGFETVPFQRSTEPKITEVKPSSEVVSKEKVVFLAKPEGNTSGAKRKAVSPPPAGAIEPPSVGPKKKLKEDWSCDICHITATSERGLFQHLQGKKHKSKETGLTVQTAGKNYAIGLFPKKAAKPIKLGEPTSNKNLDVLEKSTTKDVTPNNELALVVFQDTDDSKNKNGNPLKKMWENDGDSKQKRCKFWCEMCKVGAFSEKVMNKHRKGKKHVGKLQWLEKRRRLEVAVEVEEATHSKESEPEVDPKAEEEEMPKKENVDGDTTDGEPVENHDTVTDSDW